MWGERGSRAGAMRQDCHFFTSGPQQTQLSFVFLHVYDPYRRPNLHNQRKKGNQNNNLSKLKGGKESILPDLDQNFLFPNSSLGLAERGLRSRFWENTGARHANISSWHLSPALAASSLTLLPPFLYPRHPSKHMKPVLDCARRKGRKLAART